MLFSLKYKICLSLTPGKSATTVTAALFRADLYTLPVGLKQVED